MGDIEQKKLETEAAQHRAGVVNALEGLFASLDPERIGRESVAQLSDTGRDLADAAFQGARRNPAGLALIGIGAAMIVAQSRKGDAPRMTARTPQAAMAGQDARIAAADDKLERKARIASGRFATGELSSSKMRQMLDAGLDKLGPEARERVIAARLKAVEAQEAVERHARKAQRKVTEAHRTQPFVTGLAAAGIGALVGALLPSTRAEAELMGAKRDQMMRQAEAMLKAEIAELESRGKAAVSAGVQEAKATIRGDEPASAERH